MSRPAGTNRLRVLMMVVVLAMPGGILAAAAWLLSVAIVRRIRKMARQLRHGPVPAAPLRI